MKIRLLRGTFVENRRCFAGEVVEVSPATAGRWVGKGIAESDGLVSKTKAAVKKALVAIRSGGKK